MTDDLHLDQEKELYAVYEDYARTLRTWLVAYGVGFPAVVLSRQELFDMLKQRAEFEWIVGLFLAGTASQILLAFVNKWVAWVRFNRWREEPKSFIRRVSDWFSDQFFVDVMLELITLGSFAYATYLAVRVFVQ